MPLPTTRMDLEIIILSEVSQKRKTKTAYHLYVESKNTTQTNLPMKQKQTHRQRTDLWLPTCDWGCRRWGEKGFQVGDQPMQTSIYRTDKQGPIYSMINIENIYLFITQ